MSGGAHVVRLAPADDARRGARDGGSAAERSGPAARSSPTWCCVRWRFPNDPMYAQQWHYYEAAGGINLPAAWDIDDRARAASRSR